MKFKQGHKQGIIIILIFGLHLLSSVFCLSKLDRKSLALSQETLLSPRVLSIVDSDVERRTRELENEILKLYKEDSETAPQPNPNLKPIIHESNAVQSPRSFLPLQSVNENSNKNVNIDSARPIQVKIQEKPSLETTTAAPVSRFHAKKDDVFASSDSMSGRYYSSG